MVSLAHEKILENWVKKYTGDLFTWAFHKTSNRQTAEDLVQETFLVAAEKIEHFRNESQPKTWLFGILKNKIADHYKTAVKNFSLNPETEDFTNSFFEGDGHWKKDFMPHEWNSDEEKLFDNNEFVVVFHMCMKKLPPQWFACMTMKYLEEKEPKYVCQELGFSPTNYWQIIHRAKLQLRHCLELHWFYE